MTQPIYTASQLQVLAAAQLATQLRERSTEAMMRCEHDKLEKAQSALKTIQQWFDENHLELTHISYGWYRVDIEQLEAAAARALTPLPYISFDFSPLILAVGGIYRTRANTLVHIEAEEDGRYIYYKDREKTRTRWYSAEGRVISPTSNGRHVKRPSRFDIVEVVVHDPHLELIAGGWYESALHDRYQLQAIVKQSRWDQRHNCSYYALVQQRNHLGEWSPMRVLFTAQGQMLYSKDFLVRRLAE